MRVSIIQHPHTNATITLTVVPVSVLAFASARPRRLRKEVQRQSCSLFLCKRIDNINYISEKLIFQ